MAALEADGEGRSTPSLVRVEWFRREPGGSTLFVKPSLDEPASISTDEAAGAGETPTA